MRHYLIATQSLALPDLLVLRSTLRCLGGAARWSSVDGDVAVADLVLRGDGARCIVSSGSSRADVALPLRARDVVPHLQAVESAPPAPATVPDSGATFANPRALIEACLFGGALAGLEPWLLRIGADARLLIDGLDAQPPQAPTLALRWRCRTAPDLPGLAAQLARPSPITLGLARPEEFVDSGQAFTGTLTQLVWLLASRDPKPEPAMASGPDTLFSLTRWPDFGQLGSLDSHMRLASMLSRRPMLYSDLVATTRGTPASVMAFLNACHWTGLLAMRKSLPADDATGSAPAVDGSAGPATASSSAPSTVPNPPGLHHAIGGGSEPATTRKGWGGLVQSIRSALRNRILGDSA